MADEEKPIVQMQMLKDSEVEAVIKACVDRDQPVPRDEIERCVTWAHDVACDHAFLQNVFTGDMRMLWPEGADEPSFSLTPQGKARVEKMVADNRAKNGSTP